MKEITSITTREKPSSKMKHNIPIILDLIYANSRHDTKSILLANIKEKFPNRRTYEVIEFLMGQRKDSKEKIVVEELSIEYIRDERRDHKSSNAISNRIIPIRKARN